MFVGSKQHNSYYLNNLSNLISQQSGTKLDPPKCSQSRFIKDTFRIWEWRGWNGLPAVLTSTTLNTCGIRLSMLFMPEHQHNHTDLTLTSTNAGWGIGCHPTAVFVTKLAWGGGARLCKILPHATEASVFWIFFKVSLFSDAYIAQNDFSSIAKTGKWVQLGAKMGFSQWGEP